jgi:hypothetical protein
MNADYTKTSLSSSQRNNGAFKAVSFCGGPNCGRDHRRWSSPSQLRLGRLPQSRRGISPCLLHIGFFAFIRNHIIFHFLETLLCDNHRAACQNDHGLVDPCNMQGVMYLGLVRKGEQRILTTILPLVVSRLVWLMQLCRTHSAFWAVVKI